MCREGGGRERGRGRQRERVVEWGEERFRDYRGSRKKVN